MAQKQSSDERYTKEEMIVVAMDLGTTNSQFGLVLKLSFLTVSRCRQLFASVSRYRACGSNGIVILAHVFSFDTHHLHHRLANGLDNRKQVGTPRSAAAVNRDIGYTDR